MHRHTFKVLTATYKNQYDMTQFHLSSHRTDHSLPNSLYSDSIILFLFSKLTKLPLTQSLCPCYCLYRKDSTRSLCGWLSCLSPEAPSVSNTSLCFSFFTEMITFWNCLAHFCCCLLASFICQRSINHKWLSVEERKMWKKEGKKKGRDGEEEEINWA